MATDVADDKVQSLSTNWWALAIRGFAAVLFGLLTFLIPAITVATLVFLFGAYAIVEGVFNVIAAVRGYRDRQAWWALLLEGLVSIAAGIVAFALPGVTALALVYVIAAWAVITGAFEIAVAVRLREKIQNEWWLITAGLLSLAFGVVATIFPGAAALAVALWVGAYAVLFGATLIALAFRLRAAHGDRRARVRMAA